MHVFSTSARGRAVLATVGAVCLGASLIALPGSASADTGSPVSISYDTFATPTDLSLVASAAVRKTGVLQLTPNQDGEGGAAWSQDTVDPTADFSTDFTFNMHDSSHCPADGIDFVLQNSPAGNGAIGTFGGDMGYAGVDNSFAVEFDDFNANGGDLPGDHAGFLTGGDPDNADFPEDWSTLDVPTLYGEGPVHAWLDYTAADNDMQLYVSTDDTKPDTPVLDTTVDLGDTITGGTAYAGFTAGTGACNQFQDIQNWHLTGSAGVSGNTRLTLSSNPASPSSSTQPTITADVSRNDGDPDVPTGDVTFTVDEGGSTTVPLDGTGHASFSPDVPLDGGVHRIQATYSGDGDADAATNYLRYEVANPTSRIKIIPASGTSVPYGTAIAAAVGPRRAPRPTGTVSFYDLDNDGAPIATVPLVNGKAKLSPTALGAGNHSIEAYFSSADSNYQDAATQSLVSITQATTSTALSAKPNATGTTVALTATVKPQKVGVPTGTVTFYDGSTPIAQVAVMNGRARYTSRALASGSHTVYAVYSGDDNFTGSDSPPVFLG